jgi:hypothetical protein
MGRILYHLSCPQGFLFGGIVLEMQLSLRVVFDVHL